MQPEKNDKLNTHYVSHAPLRAEIPSTQPKRFINHHPQEYRNATQNTPIIQYKEIILLTWPQTKRINPESILIHRDWSISFEIKDGLILPEGTFADKMGIFKRLLVIIERATSQLFNSPASLFENHLSCCCIPFAGWRCAYIYIDNPSANMQNL